MKRKWGLGLLALLMSMASVFALACDKGGEEDSTGGGVTNVDQTPIKLGKVTVNVDGAYASWEAVENASGYEYSFDGGVTFTFTTETSVQISAGQTIVVRAAGDGVNYRHGDWSGAVGGNQGDDSGDVGGDDQGCTVCEDTNNDHACDTCGDELSTCEDTNNDHACDTCGDEISTCEDTDNDHDCDTCGDEVSTCEDTDNDHACDTCGDELSTCEDTGNDHDCDTCGDEISTCEDTDNDHACDICGDELSTCEDTDNDHACDTCGETISYHRDTDLNHDCDICGETVSQCADEGYDGKCDICGGAVAKPGDDTVGDVLFTGATAETVKSSGAEIEKVTAPVTGVQVTTRWDWAPVYVTVTKDGEPLTQADLKAYRYLDIKVYAEQEGTRLFLLNQPIGTLAQGENVVRVMTWDILTQTTGNADAYDYTTGAMYLQIWDAAHTIIFEEIVGVVEEKEEVPNGDAGQASSTMIVNACEGNSETNPVSWYCGTNGQVTEDKTIFSQGTSSYKLVLGANNYITTSIRHLDTAPLSVEELLAFDYLALDVYNAEEGNINLFLYNCLAATLAPGWNTVEIPRATIEEQVAQSQAAGGVLQYDGSHFYFVVYAACTLYFDNIRGVNEGAVDLGNVFILGDSYSTFEEYIPYPSDAAWYRKTPAYVTNVDKAAETWWWQLLEDTNSNLLVNASYSGTTICNTGYSGVMGEAKATSFTTRLQKYIDEGYFIENKVDTFFLFGGTNDIWANDANKFNIGEPMYEGWTENDLNFILPAFCYLIHQIKTEVRPANLVVIINDELAIFDATAVAKYKEICAHYGVNVVELAGVSKSSGHPDELGMTSIKNQIISYLKNK